MSGITGDFASMDSAIAKFKGLSDAVPRALQVAAPKIQSLCRANYKNNKGADGTKWKTNKDGTYPSLNRPAALVTFTADGNSIVGNGEAVLQYHQDGNEKLPIRAVFPEAGTIPANWQPIIEDALRAEIEKS